MTAPDLDALAGLLKECKAAEASFAAHGVTECRETATLEEEVRRGAVWQAAQDALAKATTAALPALLATARRERRMRGLLAEVREDVTYAIADMEDEYEIYKGYRRGDEYAADIKDAQARLARIDAALAEEGQDG